jgi:predicted AAA+ superfamily ATPase
LLEATQSRKISANEWNVHYKEKIERKVEDVTELTEIPESTFKVPSKFKQFKVFVTRDVLSKLTNTQYLLINFLEAPVLAFILAYLVKYYNTDLSNKVGEPLVGRQTILYLFPISVLELQSEHGNAFIEQQLEQLLIFGAYPEVIMSTSFEEKKNYLFQIRDAYLYKDILELERIRNSRKLLDLLRLIAFQIGHEVSLQELGRQLSMSKNTVERYLDLLEKSFVIINVQGFSRNLRKEITKTSRYYFYDLGIRNAIINNLNLLNSRDDVGQLWENFLFIERLKKQTYHQIHANNYFWRTWSQQEIDLIEERNGTLFGYEFSWKNKKTLIAPSEWIKAYPDTEYTVIHRDNYISFLT